MNKLKYIELLRDTGIELEVVRKVLVNIGKDVGYNVTYNEEEKEK